MSNLYQKIPANWLISIVLVAGLLLTACGGGGGGGGSDSGGSSSSDNGASSSSSSSSGGSDSGGSSGGGANGGGVAATTVYKLPATGVTADQCISSTDAFIACVGLSNPLGLSDGDLVKAGDASVRPMSYSQVASYAKTECVKDDVTGLIWEGKTVGAAAGDFRDMSKMFKNVGAGTNGSSAAAPTDAADYVSYVNNLKLCGYTDWRVPTVDELYSIEDYGYKTSSPNINTTWFPNTQRLLYTTATPYMSAANTNWAVSFNTGSVRQPNLGEALFLRLVRGTPPQASASRYTPSGDGTQITDSQTGLVWQRCSVGQAWNGSTCTGEATTLTAAEAIKLSTTATDSSGKKLRLPNLKELASIVDRTKSNPSIDAVIFPATPATMYLSSTPSGELMQPTWPICFDTGEIVFTCSGGSGNKVRLVRASQ